MVSAYARSKATQIIAILEVAQKMLILYPVLHNPQTKSPGQSGVRVYQYVCDLGWASTSYVRV